MKWKARAHAARAYWAESARRGVRALAVLSCAAAILGCAVSSADDDVFVVDVESEERRGISWDEYIGKAKLGPDGVYTVERDLQFRNMAAVRRHYENALTDREKLVVFRRLSDGFEPTFVDDEPLELTYCVANTFSNKSTVLSEMASATASWEEVANLRFVYLSAQDGACNQNNANVEFAVMPSTHPDFSGCAVNKKMWDSDIGCQASWFGPILHGVLMLNYGVSIGPGETRTGVIRHELGHMLGFRHEHPWDSPASCDEEQEYPEYDLGGRQLTDYDVASVMHYQECDGLAGTDMTISELDGEGARSVYGIPAAWYAPLLAP